MKKQIVILLVIVAICALILFSLIKLGSNQGENTTDGTGEELPVAKEVPRSPIPPGDTFPIQTGTSSVVVKNFLRTSQPLEGYDGVMAKRTGDYDILYLANNQSVLITITSKPVLAIKELAEKDLLSILGISQAEACKLKINIRTTVSVDPELAGKELGVSFCK